MRRCVEIASQPALSELTTGAYGAPAGDDDASLIAHIERNTTTIYHPVGTCGMGRVVDAELRVLGMESLRVVDASVMPTLVRGNTNAPDDHDRRARRRSHPRPAAGPAPTGRPRAVPASPEPVPAPDRSRSPAPERTRIPHPEAGLVPERKRVPPQVALP